jgi:hypothetical protein
MIDRENEDWFDADSLEMDHLTEEDYTAMGSEFPDNVWWQNEPDDSFWTEQAEISGAQDAYERGLEIEL